MLVKVANREDPDQTASEAVCSVSLNDLGLPFSQVRNFRTFTI